MTEEVIKREKGEPRDPKKRAAARRKKVEAAKRQSRVGFDEFPRQRKVEPPIRKNSRAHRRLFGHAKDRYEQENS